MSHTACKDEFRSNIRSHSWSVFSFFILSGGVRIQSTTTSYLKHVLIITAFENKSGNTVVEHDATVPNGYAVTLTFYKSIFRTSAVSSTKFASIRIFSSWLLVLEIFIIYIFTLLLSSFGQAVVTGAAISPPGSFLRFLLRKGFSNPTARRFSSSVASSRSRDFRKSICAQAKVPTSFYEYALGVARTHET